MKSLFETFKEVLVEMVFLATFVAIVNFFSFPKVFLAIILGLVAYGLYFYIKKKFFKTSNPVSSTTPEPMSSESISSNSIDKVSKKPKIDIEELPYKSYFIKNGYYTKEAISKLTDDEILAINGIGKARLKKIRSFLATSDSQEKVNFQECKYCGYQCDKSLTKCDICGNTCNTL